MIGFIHLLRVMGVGNTLKSGQIPPIISPYYCSTFGYAINLFYSPLVTYGPLIFKLLMVSYVNCLKIFTLLTIFLSGVFMYQFIHMVTKNRLMALISAIFYIVAPYRLSQIYIRFAIGEFAAMVFIPLVFMGLYNLLQDDKKKHYYLTIGAAGLILTHSITTFYIAFFAIIYLLFHFKQCMQKEVLQKGCINLLFILLITAFFTVPILENRMHAEYAIFSERFMGTTTEAVQIKSLEISQFLSDKQGEEIIFKIGLPLVFASILCFFLYSKIKGTSYEKMYLLFGLFGFFSLYMCLSCFFWIFLPPFFGIIQFAWRMLGFAVFFLSAIAGINIYLLWEHFMQTPRKVLFVYASIFVIILYILPTFYLFEGQKGEKDYAYEESVKPPKNVEIGQINREYLPVRAADNLVYILLRKPQNIIILEGNADVSKEEKQGLHMNITLKNVTANTKIELPYFYYQGYTIKVNSENTTKTIKSWETEHGFLGITIEGGEEISIEVSYTGSLLLYISYIVSLLALILFILYIRRSKKHAKILEE